MYNKFSLPTEHLDLCTDVVPLKSAENKQQQEAPISEESKVQFEAIENETFAMNQRYIEGYLLKEIENDNLLLLIEAKETIQNEKLHL